jgi:acid stress-induced BolA-like protein IbaG/YrbA
MAATAQVFQLVKFQMNPAQIQALIEAYIPGCSAAVTSADNVHYEAVIVSSAFTGKRQLQRHQMVYGALGSSMGGEIHALSIKALTPEEQAGLGG